jgi:hypothetical protein
MPEVAVSILTKLVPGDIVPHLSDGGTVAALLVLVAVVGSMLWTAVAKVLSEQLAGYLKQGPWLVILLFCLLPILLSLLARRYWTVLLIGLCGPAIWLAYYKLHRPLLWPVGLIALGLISLTAYTIEGWYFQPRFYAYIILSFETNGAAEEKRLLDLSDKYRATLAEAFRGATSVRIMPEKFDATIFNDYSPRYYEALKTKLSQSKFPPKIILRTRTDLQDNVVCFVSRFNRWGGNDLIDTGYFIQGGGAIDDLSYVVLRATFDFLLRLKEHGDFEAVKQYVMDINRRILEEYRRFLDPRLDRIEPWVSDRLNQMLKSDFIHDQDIRQVLDAYRGPGCATESASKDARERDANLEKVRNL